MQNLDMTWLARIAAHDGARRELLWVRAQSVGDRLSTAMLEETDPTLRRRMEALLRRSGLTGLTDAEERRAALERLWDERIDGAVDGWTQVPPPPTAPTARRRAPRAADQRGPTCAGAPGAP